jgi:hypothetical protein
VGCGPVVTVWFHEDGAEAVLRGEGEGRGERRFVVFEAEHGGYCGERDVEGEVAELTFGLDDEVLAEPGDQGQ